MASPYISRRKTLVRQDLHGDQSHLPVVLMIVAKHHKNTLEHVDLPKAFGFDSVMTSRSKLVFGDGIRRECIYNGRSTAKQIMNEDLDNIFSLRVI